MKYTLHKPSSKIYPYSEPSIIPGQEWRGLNCHIKGMGQFGAEVCQKFETRNLGETTLVNLLMFWQNNITNRRLYYKIKNFVLKFFARFKK